MSLGKTVTKLKLSMKSISNVAFLFFFWGGNKSYDTSKIKKKSVLPFGTVRKVLRYINIKRENLKTFESAAITVLCYVIFLLCPIFVTENTIFFSC